MTTDELICQLSDADIIYIMKNDSLFLSIPKSSQLLCVSKIDSKNREVLDDPGYSDGLKADVLMSSDSLNEYIGNYLIPKEK